MPIKEGGDDDEICDRLLVNKTELRKKEKQLTRLK